LRRSTIWPGSVFYYYHPSSARPFFPWATLLVNLAILLALRLWAVRDGQEAVGWELMLSHVQWFFGLSALWLLMAAVLGLYAQRTLSKVVDSLLALAGITGLFLLAYVVIYFFAPVGMLPRRFVLYTGVLSLVLVGVWRAAYITISTGLMLARSASVGQRGGVTELVGEIIRQTLASDGQQASEVPSAYLEGRGIEEEVYTVQEVAELLKVHKATVWRWCRSGDLRAFRVGQQWRIAASDLQRVMDARANMRDLAGTRKSEE